MLHTGSVRRKWWSSGSTRKYLNIEFDQKRSIRSWRKSAYCTPSLDAFAYPIVYLTVPDWVVDAVTAARCCRERFVADEEVQVLGTTLSGQMPTGSSTTGKEGGLVRDRRTSGARPAATACWAFRSYGRGEDEGGGVVAGETWRCTVTTTRVRDSFG
jgi:hypothetical protein